MTIGRPSRAGVAAAAIGLLLVLPARAAGSQVVDTVAEPARALQQIPAERARLDRAVEQELRATFDRIESLSSVEIRVDAGIATLTGPVPSIGARLQADSLSRLVTGVILVDNRIEVDTSLRTRLADTLEQLRIYILDIVAWLPLLVVAVFIVGLAVLLGNLLMRWRLAQRRASRNPFLRNLIQRGLRAVIVIAGLAIALDLLGATRILGLIAGTAGLAGLAFSFAFKDIMENYLAGVILSLRQPFAPSDHVVIEGQEGKVVRLTARETILMTLDGNHVRLPNALVFRGVITNYTRNPLRRFFFSISISTADDLARVQDFGLAALRAMPGVLDEPPPQSMIERVGDSWVDVTWLGWVDQRRSEFLKVRSEAIRLVKLALEHGGVTMPSPEYRVVVARPTAVPAGRPAAVPQPVAAGEARDLSVDTALDEQIEVDRRVSEDPDLLRTDAGGQPTDRGPE